MYLVWVPLRGAEESHVAEATRAAGDGRVSHYWDGADSVGELYASVLGISPPAWDVYLLFDRHQKWEGELPPRPVFWMHQLEGVTGAPRLHARAFARQADQL